MTYIVTRINGNHDILYIYALVLRSDRYERLHAIIHYAIVCSTTCHDHSRQQTLYHLHFGQIVVVVA